MILALPAVWSVLSLSGGPPEPTLSLWSYPFQAFFNSDRDCEYPFNSAKKRSSVLINNSDGTLRLYTKGASETSE